MRKLLLSLLLASAAVSPALAQSNDPDRRARADRADRADREDRADRQQARAERQQQREERQQAREQRAPSVDRAQVNVERGDNAGAQFDAERRAQRQEIRRQRLGDAAERDVLQQRVGGGDLRETRRPVPHVFRNRVPVVSNEPREGTQPPLRAERHRRNPAGWNSDWRRDHRHDWRNWRNRHRSLFRIGVYYDPFGWNYRPYSVGWRLWPSYYSSRYQINDPWQYRLPYAPPGYRWIRYWDDAILVDTWSGQVVDVIHNFFW